MHLARTSKAALRPPHSIWSRAYAPPLKKTFVIFVPFVVINPSRKLHGLRGSPHLKSGVDACSC
jgi:hypothetical protein